MGTDRGYFINNYWAVGKPMDISSKLPQDTISVNEFVDFTNDNFPLYLDRHFVYCESLCQEKKRSFDGFQPSNVFLNTPN